MKLKGTIAPGWSGQVVGFDLFDVTQLLALSGRTRLLQVTHGDREGYLLFQGGNMVHASTGEVSGQEAFFEMAAWEGGAFENVDAYESDQFLTNIRVPTMHLLMEAARKRDEAKEGAQTRGDTTEEPDTDPDLASEEFWAELAEFQQRVAERIVQDEDEAVAEASEERPEGAEAGAGPTEPAPEASSDTERDWWLRARGRWGESVQVVVACPPETPWRVASAEVARLAEELDAKAPAVELSSNGPSFVRIHSDRGGVLSMTFVPMSRRHGFLFETLVRSAQVAFIHEDGDGEALKRWVQCLPPEVQWLPFDGTGDGTWMLSARLLELLGGE